jgi:hypothetical protein
MSRIEQAWRRTAPDALDNRDEAFSIDRYPVESAGEAAAESVSSAPRVVVPHGREGLAPARVVMPPRPLLRSDKPSGSSECQGQPAQWPQRHPELAAAGMVEQCARLVDVAQARAHPSALNVVVVTTPMPNVHAAQAAIHVARLLAASHGEAVMLADTTGGDPHLPALLEFEGLATGEMRAVKPGASGMPQVQLITITAEHHALAGRLRAVAEDAGVRWVVAHAPAVTDMPDDTALHAMVRLGDNVILVLPASTPMPVLGQTVAAVGRERLLGTVLVGIEDA